MTAGGMPVWSLLKPFGLLALLVSIGIAIVNHLGRALGAAVRSRSLRCRCAPT